MTKSLKPLKENKDIGFLSGTPDKFYVMAEIFEQPLSEFIQNFFASRAALNSRAYNTHIGAIFVLSNGESLKYGTSDITMTSICQAGISNIITPITFTARLSGVPDFRQSQGKTPDAGDFEIINLDYLLTQAITGEERLYDNCFVTTYLCFPKPDGTYEGLIYFEGLLRAPQGDDEEFKPSVISQFSHRASVVGKEITQRCVNILGDTWCGVTHLPVGAVCSKIKADKEKGCAYWGGVFNGVAYGKPSGLSDAAVTSGGGWGTGVGGHCPDLQTTWFESANGGFIHARDLKAGESIIFENKVSEVEETRIIHQPYRYKVQTRFGAGVIVSASHLFLRSIDDGKGKAAMNWNFNEMDLICRINNKTQIAEHKEKDSRSFNYWFRVASPGDCLEISLKGENRYWCGNEKGKFIGSHNKPPIYNPVE